MGILIMNTYIKVAETSIVGWSSGSPATKDFFSFEFTPEHPLEAYEYITITETITVPDPDDLENSTIEEELITGYAVQVRDDWVPETPEEEDTP